MRRVIKAYVVFAVTSLTSCARDPLDSARKHSTDFEGVAFKCPVYSNANPFRY